MKDKKLLLNTLFGFFDQIVTIVCGFILPRCFLVTYGSNVNGLVTSITQFLGFITLMDLGISAVVKSSLYRPLAEKQFNYISAIMISAKKFYKKLIQGFIVYLFLLCVFFPLKVYNEFDFLYTFTLILSMSISLIAQYYFGILYQTLIDADQKNYINSILRIITLIISTILSVILMVVFKSSIQLVKLVTSLIFIIKPIYLNYYVKKRYDLNFNYKFEGEPIKQKWNGILQHFASVVLQNTDVFVLTIFSTLKNISIYNVYSLVVLGVKNIIISLTSGIQSKMGYLFAKEKQKELNQFFSQTEFVLHSLTTFFFTACALLIVPFIKVYTKGILDANYDIPLFGVLLTIAQMFYCMRLPYSQLVLAAGHFRETQKSAIIEMMLNIFLSIALVKSYGLIGVTIGTLIAMLYRTIYYVIYISKNIINRSTLFYIKHLVVNLIIFVVSYLLCFNIHLQDLTYLAWIILALKVCLIIWIVFYIINYLFYKYELNLIQKFILKIFKNFIFNLKIK